jgi:hypothetical protein
VRLGKPKQPELYEQVEQEGIVIYFKPSFADTFEKVTVKMDNFLFFKSLMAKEDKGI